MQSNKVLVTGAAGFVGYFLSKRLCAEGFEVTGLDNLNDYYEVSLKEARLKELLPLANFSFHQGDLTDAVFINELFEKGKFDYIIHLAAQAGVRYSIENPKAYIESNISGFLNVLEACRKYTCKHLIYASSSSVYGANVKMPFAVQDAVDHPVSLYAATKKSNELMAHTYSHLYGIPTTGLRFFTVYGPYGRPDMAYFSFTRDILSGKPIKVFNFGKMKRDFTYIDDIVEGIYRLIPHIPAVNSTLWDANTPDPSASFAPYRVFNIGNNEPVELNRFIEVLEEHLGKKAKRELLPMQDGDVVATYADISPLQREVGFKPSTSIEKGLAEFVKWYRSYYKVK
ncbi:NAD-dependent epimerase [Penaeicola halotolerans]|uniref:NAD-dependent epimerase n=1 Tax=Penaeicola halotolerans TaxID=2793196 RepID=UPI001CF8BE37|nr:NAD-dependent epimerase [Penaeicola halotolerans]